MTRLMTATALLLSLPLAALGETPSLSLIEHAGTVAAIDAAPEGDSVGDTLAFSGEIYATDNSTLRGSDAGSCVRTVVGARYECSWTITLDEGQIMVAGPFLDTGDSRLAVTGGTGAFSGARGEMLLHARKDDGSEYDFVFDLK